MTTVLLKPAGPGSRAKKTSAMPPDPMRRTSSYLPKDLGSADAESGNRATVGKLGVRGLLRKPSGSAAYGIVSFLMANPVPVGDVAGVWVPSACDAEAWAGTWATPFYGYRMEGAFTRIQSLRAALGPDVSLLYALKANANRVILARLRPHLCGADVASIGELKQALAVGFQGAQLGLTGPGKSAGLLQAAVGCGASISVESIDELRQLAQLARAMGGVARVLLRINPEQQIHAFRMATGGICGPFGLEESDLMDAIQIAKMEQDVLRCDGVHVHAGSQCTSAAAWYRHAKQTLDLAARAQDMGMSLRRVNFGGGFGVLPQIAKHFDVDELGEKLRPALLKFTDRVQPQMQFIVEPGRYLMSEAGCFVTRVLRRRLSKGRVVVVVDGGLNAFLFATSHYHDSAPPTVLNLSRPQAHPLETMLVGPSCTPLDTLGDKLQVPDPQPGDLLALGPAGAYGFSASPHMFLGHDVPAELLSEDGEVQCIREPRSLQDFD